MEHDTKRDHYMKEKLKYLGTLQDEVNLGRELVTSKYQIDSKALVTIYEQLGYPISGQEKSRIEEVIWQVNDDLDGAISFEEFVNSYVRSRNDRSGLEPSEIFFLTCFLMFDKDCCGRVSPPSHRIDTPALQSCNLTVPDRFRVRSPWTMRWEFCKQRALHHYYKIKYR